MKYKGILCAGHPRSGTHYITALISLNFLNNENYLAVYGQHVLPDIVTDTNTAYFYIWRGFDSVAKSMYALKERFGLNVESYEAYLGTRYSEMWGIEKPDSVVTNVRTLSQRAKFNGIVDIFKGVDMTPREYWTYYNKKWAECAEECPNVFGIRYEKIREDFNAAMLDIADKLGSSRCHFTDINQRIGWGKQGDFEKG